MFEIPANVNKKHLSSVENTTVSLFNRFKHLSFCSLIYFSISSISLALFPLFLKVLVVNSVGILDSSDGYNLDSFGLSAHCLLL